MTDAQHTPPGDRSFAASLARHVVAAVALIAAVALGFWLIGRVRPPQDGPVIGAPTVGISPTDGAATDGPTPETAPPGDATAGPTAADGPTASPSPDDDADRADISVQVLDAAGDGGERLEAVVERLRELGYQVVATGRAIRTYERSTLFYTEGHRDDALQVQRDLPAFGVVDEKPDNLAESVDVHVIVGRDHPGP